MKMKSKALVFIAFVLFLRLTFAADDHEKVSSKSTEGTTSNEKKGNDAQPKMQVDIHPNGYDIDHGVGGYGGGGSLWHGGGGGGGGTSGQGDGGGGAGAGGGSSDGFNAGFSHGGAYGSGRKCYWGCCSESYGYSHGGGGYYSCKCCMTFAEAKAYKDSQAKAQTKT